MAFNPYLAAARPDQFGSEEGSNAFLNEMNQGTQTNVQQIHDMGSEEAQTTKENAAIAAQAIPNAMQEYRTGQTHSMDMAKGNQSLQQGQQALSEGQIRMQDEQQMLQQNSLKTGQMQRQDQNAQAPMAGDKMGRTQEQVTQAAPAEEALYASQTGRPQQTRMGESEINRNNAAATASVAEAGRSSAQFAGQYAPNAYIQAGSDPAKIAQVDAYLKANHYTPAMIESEKRTAATTAAGGRTATELSAQTKPEYATAQGGLDKVNKQLNLLGDLQAATRDYSKSTNLSQQESESAAKIDQTLRSPELGMNAEADHFKPSNISAMFDTGGQFGISTKSAKAQRALQTATDNTKRELDAAEQHARNIGSDALMQQVQTARARLNSISAGNATQGGTHNFSLQPGGNQSQANGQFLAPTPNPAAGMPGGQQVQQQQQQGVSNQLPISFAPGQAPRAQPPTLRGP